MHELHLEDALDAEFGIVGRVTEHRQTARDLPVHVYSARLCDTSVFSPIKATQNNGGASSDRDAAFRAALGESLERYCLGFNDRTQWRAATAAELGAAAVDLSRFAWIPRTTPQNGAFSGYLQYAPELELDWVRGREVRTARACWIPANLIYVPFQPTNGRFIDRPISTGAALDATYDGAALKGMLEAIERDAFMQWWLTRSTAVRLPRELLVDAGVGHIAAAADDLGLDLHVFLMVTDLEIPVVVAITRALDPALGSSLAIGAASRLSLLDAARKAVVEMAHGRMWQNSMLAAQDADAYAGDGLALKHISDHPLLWARYRPAEPLWFEHPQFGADATMPLVGGLRNAADLAAHLHAKGFEPVAVDITREDVRALGACVVRVLVPGLHPLEVGGLYHLDSPRLKNRLGLAAEAEAADVHERVNPILHPFP